MDIGNMRFESVAIVDANDAVIAILSDDKCVVYSGAKIIGNPEVGESTKEGVMYAFYEWWQQFA